MQLAAVLLTLLGSTELGAPVPVESNGKPIVADCATPYFVDWDGDGRRDLLVGQYNGGKLRRYSNRGTDAAPSFAEFEYIHAGGTEAAVPPW